MPGARCAGAGSSQARVGIGSTRATFMSIACLLSEAVAPAARALSLPCWTATAFALLALGGLAYAERGVWLSRSLWALGVVARAWRTVAS